MINISTKTFNALIPPNTSQSWWVTHMVFLGNTWAQYPMHASRNFGNNTPISSHTQKITMLYFAWDTYCISMIEIMDQLFAIWTFITNILTFKSFWMTKSQCVDRKCNKTWKIWCNHPNRSHLGHNHDFLKTCLQDLQTKIILKLCVILVCPPF